MALFVMVSVTLQIFGQSPTDDIFQKYEEKDGFTTVEISKELFSLFADIAQESDNEDVRDMNKMINGLDKIRILMYEVPVTSVKNGSDDDNKNIDATKKASTMPVLTVQSFKNDLDALQLKDFSVLMTVKEDNETVKFLIRKNEKTINELLLIIKQNDQMGFISITGDIDLKSIANLSKAMNIKELQNLNKLNEK